jgi:hypothetical protein
MFVARLQQKENGSWILMAKLSNVQTWILRSFVLAAT